MRLSLTLDLDCLDGDYLERCARIRKISRHRLVRRLIEAIAKDQLVLGILDDESKPAEKLAGETTKSRFHRRQQTKCTGQSSPIGA